jgi:aspartate/methionine/tyrosine aminotransferase
MPWSAIVLLSGISRADVMTGWRIGYLAGPPEPIRVRCAHTAVPTATSR